MSGEATPECPMSEREDGKHVWQPNGLVDVDKMSKSPCSTWDDQFWTDTYSVALCLCGATKRALVGSKNVRRRGDKMRRN